MCHGVLRRRPIPVPGFWFILRLFNSSKDAVERIGAPIKNAGSRQPEFLASCGTRHPNLSDHRQL